MDRRDIDESLEESRNFRVLVVDDEPAVVAQLSDGLRVLGYDVLQASNVQTALSTLAADPTITVVVSDVRMPESDGLGLARRIMSERSDSDAVEVVLITGHATIEDAAAAVRARAVDFLRKPFRLREAGDAVARAHDRAKVRRRKLAQQKQVERRLRELDSGPIEATTASRGRSDDSGASLIPHDGENAHRREMRAISHALRTPLVAIAGSTDLLTRDVGLCDARAQEHLDLLRDGVKDAIAAVTLVEELKQLDSTPPAAEAANVDASAMLDAVLRSLQAQGAFAGFTLLPIAPAAVCLRFSKDELRRLLVHCLLSVPAWARPRSGMRIAWAMPTPSTASLSIEVSSPGAALTLGTGTDSWLMTTAAPASALTRTQEGLRFSIAERLASRNNATLRSYGGGEGRMTIVLHAPRCACL